MPLVVPGIDPRRLAEYAKANQQGQDASEEGDGRVKELSHALRPPQIKNDRNFRLTLS